MSGPLQGIRVVDLTMNVLGPFASQILGDMGADVTKVEPPPGDTLRGVGPSRTAKMGPFFLALNRNKRSIILDLKNPASKPVIARLLEQADVLLFALRPAAMQRLGLSYENVAKISPRIIYCGAFGYGQGGPYAERPAYDDLIQGATALATIQARPGEEPRYVNTALMDRVVGMAAASAIGMALYHRERTGRGQSIQVPMFETMTQFVMGDHLYGLAFEPPIGGSGYPRLLDPDRRPYKTKDGYVSALMYTDKHWMAFFVLAGHPEMADDPRHASIFERTQIIGQLYRFVADAMLAKTSAEWIRLFDESDIPIAPLHTPESLIEDPHMKAVDFFPVVEHPTEGKLRMMGMPSTWSETQPEVQRLPPVAGEHTVELLRENGFDADAIEGFIKAGVAVDGRARQAPNVRS